MIYSRPKSYALIIPIALAVAAIGLSYWGWLSHPDPAHPLTAADIAYKAVRNIGPGSDFDSAGADRNPALNIARWLGVVVAFWAVLSLLHAGLRTTRIRLMSHLRNGHLVVIGGTAFADHVSEIAAGARSEVTQLREGDAISVNGELIRLPYALSDPHTLVTANSHKARRLVIAVGDDARALDLAMAAQKQFPKLNVSTRLDDSWLARSLHTLPGAEKLRAFTEQTAAAREIIRRHPPYLAAQDLAQTRIHSVMMGDHDWLEALMVETILSACTLTYGKPAFSFVCADPDGFRQRLRERFPDIDNAADVAVYAGHYSPHMPLLPQTLSDIFRLGPVTAIYCALDDGAASLSTGVALRERMLHEPDFKAAIFVRMEGNAAPRPPAGSHLAPCAVVPFGALGDITRATGILSVHGEDAERAWHNAYLKFAPNDKAAAKPWDELPEEFRTSNQRAVGHMFAKLFEAGFDLRPWLAAHDPWAQLPTLAKGENLWRSQAERTRLAELEHERWTADRRMSGWVGGPQRDNARKIHDNIVPFEQLTDELKGYDYQFVDLLATVLKRSKDGLKRRP